MNNQNPKYQSLHRLHHLFLGYDFGGKIFKTGEGVGIWISELIYTPVISGNILSCSVVDCPFFKEVILQANPHLDIPSRRTVMRAVLSEETEVLTYSFKPKNSFSFILMRTQIHIQILDPPWIRNRLWLISCPLNPDLCTCYFFRIWIQGAICWRSIFKHSHLCPTEVFVGRGCYLIQSGQRKDFFKISNI